MKWKLLALPILLVPVLLSACTPNQVSLFQSLTPQQQDAVVTHMRSRPAPSRDCYEAIDKHWPASSRSWARSIVWRESRNQSTARNPRSTSRGCFGLLQSLHGWRYNAVGCQLSAWMDPDCSVRAALHLYNEAGVLPWRT